MITFIIHSLMYAKYFILIIRKVHIMERKITRKDIAQKAGTSVSVVSRALNKSGYVEEEKRRKILQIARELNYIPNVGTGALREQKTKQIVFFCNDLRNPFYIQMYQGMLDAVRDKEYRVVLDGNTILKDIRGITADGIIFSNQIMAGRYLDTYGKNYDIPIVCASYGDTIDMKKAITMVEVDMFKAVEIGLSYLWSMGHHKIAYATPYNTEYSSREIAYVSWLRERHINPEKYMIKVPLCYEQDSPYFDYHVLGRMAAFNYVESNNSASAILAFNDEYAYGIMDGLLEKGISIPEDVSIVGMDGTYTRQYMSPGLTTVSLFPEKQGALCVHNMMNIIDKKSHKYITRITPKIIEGNTVSQRKGSKARENTSCFG